MDNLHKDYYTVAKEHSKQLLKRVLEIPQPNGNLLQTHFVSSAEYVKGKGYVELAFDPKLRPYLLELKSHFTAYKIKYVLKLQSAHSIRIYELLKQFETIGERTFQVEELKELLGVQENYDRYYDFKKYVILQAKKELTKHCDITFDFEEFKESRRVVKIKFIIVRTQQASPLPEHKETGNAGELQLKLQTFGLTVGQIKKYISNQSEAQIWEKIHYLEAQIKKEKVNEPTKYLVYLLENEVAINTKKEAEKKEQKLKNNPLKKQAEKLQEQQQLEALKVKYEEYRGVKINAFYANSGKNDWVDFEKHVKDNFYLSGKLLKDGTLNREHEECERWFRSFLGKQFLPDFDQGFAAWAKENGYPIA